MHTLNGGLKRKKNEYVTSMYSLSRAIINRHALKNCDLRIFPRMKILSVW